jgi:hypothetical protein
MPPEQSSERRLVVLFKETPKDLVIWLSPQTLRLDRLADDLQDRAGLSLCHCPLALFCLRLVPPPI